MMMSPGLTKRQPMSVICGVMCTARVVEVGVEVELALNISLARI